MVDLRVMNNFADNEQSPFFEYFARGVSKIYRALDTVAEPKLLGQTHSRVADRYDSPGTPNFFDNVAAIMRLHLLLDGRHHIRCAQIYSLASSGAARNQVRTHVVVVILSAVKNLGSIHHRTPK